MAQDKLNQGSEEEKKSSKDLSDDDFGLPDLEFDELQELDMSFDDEESDEEAPASKSNNPFSGSDDIDMSVLDDIDVSSDFSSDTDEGIDLDSVLDEGIEEVEDVLDSAQLISDRLGDDDDEDEDSLSTNYGSSINYDDLMGDSDSGDSIFASDDVEDSSSLGDFDDSVMSSDDLLASIDSPDDLAALGMADDDDDDLDSSDSLFSADTSSDADVDSLFDADSVSYGSSSYDDEDFATSDDKKLPDNYKAYTYTESSGGFTKIIVIGVVVIAVIAAGMLWLSGGQDAEKTKIAEKKAPVVTKKVEEPVAEEPAVVEPTDSEQLESNASDKPQPKSAAASSAPAGQIEQVTAKTGLSYVIIGSFIDQDLAMDYANELSAEGKGVKIIQPFGDSKRYRVSVADFPSYGDAASQLNSFKDEFGSQVWALKY